MNAAEDSTGPTVPPVAVGDAVPTICVLGNPNAGKSTLFNRLTGLSQKVGNYPGVTVEKKEGFLELGGGDGRRTVRLIDLPGTYSLSANSPDELIAVDVLLGRAEGESPPALVLHIADASNLARNLYLFSQLQELGVPAILVLNMMDVAKKRGICIDVDALSDHLGVRVVPTEGHRGRGLDALGEAILAELDARADAPASPGSRPGAELPPPLRHAVDEVREATRELSHANLKRELHPYEILRALVDAGGYAEDSLARRLGDSVHDSLAAARAKIPSDTPPAALEADARYRWVRERIKGCVEKGPDADGRRNWSETLDRVLTHRILGLLVFGAMMFVVFEAIFSWAQPLMEWVDTGFGSLGNLITTTLPEGALTSLLADGLIAGVGAVVIFLPQILILFLFIGILEDCGYMARAAFLMDKVMSKCGLSGKSFIPMLSGFACAIPGIMATRVIEDRRDRIATVLVTPLMTCSARLPVYAILIETFIPGESLLGGWLGLQAVTLLGLYVLGIVAAIVMAWLFKKTLLRGGASTFILELPTYKWPSLRMVFHRLYDRAKAFLTRAGTIILAITVIVWALAYFPHPSSIANDAEARRQAVEQEFNTTPANETATREALQERLTQIDQAEAGDYLNQSFFGRMGKTVEPAFRPLGWDWRISMAAIMSFPAREVIVSTLGTIYNLGEETDEESPGLRQKLRESKWPGTQKPVYTVPVALSIMVFFALCCQCGATVATIKRETNSWRWAWFTFGYMTVLAYIGALVTYQVGTALAGA